ncbi:hypothetical protein OGATHE_001595 [Ogataea polymorpha]|uniref:Uncharacterized protein n=1 Tax=Ogataea polymorpha TaxID=460523 RepID=A0A9P8PPL3_9ASCO|nr:hypothetical protein OGATHE_001595 [Ogataea polymorpha]
MAGNGAPIMAPTRRSSGVGGLCLMVLTDQRRDDPHEAGKRKVDPEDQLEPARVPRDKTSHERANHGATVRSSSKVCDGLTSGLGREQVGDRATHVGEAGSGENTAQEPTHQNCADIRSNSTGDVEDEVEPERDEVDRPRHPVTTDEPNATHTTISDNAMVNNHLSVGLQFIGFSGSLILNVTNSISGSSSGTAPVSFSSDPDELCESPGGLVAIVWLLARPISCNVATGTNPVCVSKVYSSGNTGFSTF